MQHSHFTSRLVAFAIVLSLHTALIETGLHSLVIAEDKKTQPITQQEATQIAVEAYIYFYPLVMMDVTRRQLTNVEPGKVMGRGPMNTFAHMRSFPPADFREVVRPNFNTLYSSGWLDLTAEPMIVSVPDTNGRYYLLPMIDMWSDVFASPGKRTTGTKAGHFAIVPPGWSGKLPKEVERIDSPTPYVWILGRTQTNGQKDYNAVHKIQDGYKITSLSRWNKEPQPVTVKIDPALDVKTAPLDQLNTMSAKKFFSYAADLMKINPPHITDQPIVARLKRLGIEVGEKFDFDKADPTIKRALEAAPASGLKAMKAKRPTLARSVNGWEMNTDTVGVYGTYYLKRAIVAMLLLGANLPEDSIYPVTLTDGEGKPLSGANSYVLKFKKADLPPVEAFWSVTLYDKEGFAFSNSLNRYAIGDQDALKYNEDGSLDVYIQRTSPGQNNESNWLPAPEGTFNLIMRLYAPRTSALNGDWSPPPVVQQK